MAGYEGARWLRTDLHVHTPFDPTRAFGEDIRAAVSAAATGDPSRLSGIANRFVDACISAQLDVVGVTDHNSISGLSTMGPFIAMRRSEAESRGEPFPTFFPGVEITSGGERPVHFLILFPEESNLGDLERLIGHLFGPVEPFEGDQPNSTGRSIDEFLRHLKEYCEPAAGDRPDIPTVLLPAHLDSHQGLGRETGVDTAGGLYDEMRGRVRQRAIVRSDWHGFEVRREFDALPHALQDLVHEWYAKRRGRRWTELTHAETEQIRSIKHWPLVMGSDAKSYQEIGQRSTWLKMAAPSLEGIRLALLDPESRLRPGALPAPGADYPHIERLRVRRSDFIDDIEVWLSPNLNAIIGGRGTGKSTLLELIRYALDRTRVEDRQDGRVRELVEQLLGEKGERDFGQTAGILLPETSVEVDVAVAGTTYKVVRTADGIAVTDPQDWLKSGSLDIRALLGPRILSQGQIAEIAQDPTAQLHELDATVDSEIRDFEKARSEADASLEARQLAFRRLSQQREILPALETELRTTGDKIAFLEQGENQELLRRMGAYRAEQQWLQAAMAALDQLSQAAVADQQSTLDVGTRLSAPPAGGPTADWLLEVESQVREQVSTSAASAQERSLALTAQKASTEAAQAARWLPGYQATSQSFAGLQGRLRERDVQFSQHRQLIGRRLELEQQLQPLRDIDDRLAAAEQQVEAAWRALRDIHVARAGARMAAAARLREEDRDIRVEVIPFGDVEDLRSRRDEWFGGTGLQDRDWDLVVDYVYSKPNGVADRLHEWVSRLALDVERTSTTGRTLAATDSESARVLPRAPTGHFFNALGRMTRQSVDAAARFFMEDAVLTQVRDASGVFKPIQQGSLGQRATAVLSLLLAAGDQPLIIDQPEEDLDNAYIYDVIVSLLRDRKFTRQLILATHNPNIPVNGDAEQIITVEVASGLGVVICSGSIDLPAVKDQVSRVLEGSSEAFRLRAERYGY